MQIPSYFLRRPATADEHITDFERLYRDFMEEKAVTEIDYRLTAPKWQFLCYLCDSKEILLHGSANPDIREFEPRQSNDVDEFGNRKAVYAASDGIWPMYFAIANREKVTSLVNSCFRFVENGQVSEPYYYFSINQDAHSHNPWQSGMIYLLPHDMFEQQPLQHYHGRDIEIEQWARSTAVKPLAKLSVTPADFPFLGQVNGHKPLVVSERSLRDPDAFPWRD